jgi:hypothetical protein
MDQQKRRRSIRWLVAGISAVVPMLAWFVGTAYDRKRKKLGVGKGNTFAPGSVEDFTPEQIALLGRVREICDARL